MKLWAVFTILVFIMNVHVVYLDHSAWFNAFAVGYMTNSLLDLALTSILKKLEE